MVKKNAAPTQKQNQPEDLLDMALSGGGGSLSYIAGARVVVRGIADQIHVLTNIGNDNLDGMIANGFAHALLQADRDLEAAMRRGPKDLEPEEVLANAKARKGGVQ
jgi:hypothetical protein